MSSLNLKNPANPSRHAVASHRSASELNFSASQTIASSISTITGYFLTTGLDSERWRPSNVALTNGSTNGGHNLALLCTQYIALPASSTTALDLVSSRNYCRYNVKWWGFAGIACKVLALAQIFHLQKAHKYFDTVLSAQLFKMVAGSLLAKAFNPGSSSSSRNLQLPCALTSVGRTTHTHNAQPISINHTNRCITYPLLACQLLVSH